LCFAIWLLSNKGGRGGGKGRKVISKGKKRGGGRRDPYQIHPSPFVLLSSVEIPASGFGGGEKLKEGGKENNQRRRKEKERNFLPINFEFGLQLEEKGKGRSKGGGGREQALTKRAWDVFDDGGNIPNVLRPGES